MISIPGWGTKIPLASECDQKKIFFLFFFFFSFKEYSFGVRLPEFKFWFYLTIDLSKVNLIYLCLIFPICETDTKHPVSPQ